MQRDEVAKGLESEIQQGMDDAIEALRWARRHLQDRPTAEMLRLVQNYICVLALAVDWHMEGDDLRAAELLGRLWWSPHKQGGGPLDMNPTGH
jgi:hypothetical protein